MFLSVTFILQDGKIPLSIAASANHLSVLRYLFKKEHNTITLMEDSSVSTCFEILFKNIINLFLRIHASKMYYNMLYMRVTKYVYTI